MVATVGAFFYYFVAQKLIAHSAVSLFFSCRASVISHVIKCDSAAATLFCWLSDIITTLPRALAYANYCKRRERNGCATRGRESFYYWVFQSSLTRKVKLIHHVARRISFNVASSGMQIQVWAVRKCQINLNSRFKRCISALWTNFVTQWRVVYVGDACWFVYSCELHFVHARDWVIKCAPNCNHTT